jgi:hypothetical protein
MGQNTITIAKHAAQCGWPIILDSDAGERQALPEALRDIVTSHASQTKECRGRKKRVNRTANHFGKPLNAPDNLIGSTFQIGRNICRAGLNQPAIAPVVSGDSAARATAIHSKNHSLSGSNHMHTITIPVIIIKDPNITNIAKRRGKTQNFLLRKFLWTKGIIKVLLLADGGFA